MEEWALGRGRAREKKYFWRLVQLDPVSMGAHGMRGTWEGRQGPKSAVPAAATVRRLEFFSKAMKSLKNLHLVWRTVGKESWWTKWDIVRMLWSPRLEVILLRLRWWQWHRENWTISRGKRFEVVLWALADGQEAEQEEVNLKNHCLLKK